MRLFREVSLPEWCYIGEAVYWIALGRTPEFSPDEKGREDYRLSIEAEDYGSYFGFRTRFEASELLLHGVSVDEQQLFDAYEMTYGRTVEEIEKSIDEADNFATGSKDAFFQQTIERQRKALINAKWLNQIKLPLEAALDDAIASIFQAVRSTKIESMGWLKHTEDDKSDHENEGEFSKIPAGHWSFRNLDVQQGTLLFDQLKYKCVMVSTSQLLEHQPNPLGSPIAQTGQVFGETVIVSGNSASHTPRRGRGRPAKQAPSAAAIIAAEFKRRKAKGKLESIKKEAILVEAVEWARVVLGIEISRTTAQRYLEPVFPDLHK